VRLDYEVNWDEVAAILKDGYLMSAPKRLGGHVPSAMDEAASMSNIATKRRITSISKMMPTANGKTTATRKSSARKKFVARPNENR